MINFPAITVCPLDNVSTLVALECAHEHDGQLVLNCSAPTVDYVVSEGVNLTCMTFNNPPSNGVVIQATSVDEEIAIEIQVQPNRLLSEAFGVIVLLHDQGVPPEISEGSSMLVDTGELTEFWLSKTVDTEIDGTVEVSWTAEVTAVTLNPNVVGVNTSMIVDMDFAFTEVGYYNEQQYYAYTVDNWIGEVGGLAALLLFLHRAFLFLVMALITFLHNRKHGHSGASEMREGLRE